MGVLVDGVWQQQQVIPTAGGKFVRPDVTFRNWITRDGSPGPSGEGGFIAEKSRYHLYVSVACPWAHRTLIVRKLKGLEDFISISVVNWLMLDDGWTFEEGPGVIPDPVNNAKFMYQVYIAADPKYTGRVTVPVLWDKKTNTIVNNESSEIIRMFNEAFDDIGAKPGNYYPVELRGEIDAINDRVYKTLNNGVYRCGFAATQTAYEEAVVELFDSLDWLEGILSKQRYLVGGRLTEADIRLFVTLIRFDAVYVGHFKCNLRRIVDYPAVWGFVRDVYHTQGIGSTVDFEHIKGHYHASHRTINPTGIIPKGPILDLDAPHGREALP